MYSFKGQVVWVTGSSTGIGRAAALAFAEYGADVVVHCNSRVDKAEEVVKAIEDKGQKAFMVQGDVADKEQVNKMVSQIEATFGKIDVLMNNAGSMVQRARLAELDEDTWHRILDVNLTSVYLVTKRVLPLFKKQGGGRVINLTSIAARTGGSIGSLAYATSKGGVTTLTRGMAKDLVEYNVRVNAIAPGIITTPFHERFSSKEFLENIVTTIPMGREGTPMETIGAALFLASDYASYITGETIEVNGGQLMS